MLKIASAFFKNKYPLHAFCVVSFGQYILTDNDIMKLRLILYGTKTRGLIQPEYIWNIEKATNSDTYCFEYYYYCLDKF